MKFTILGSSGFIGKALSQYLKELGYECFCPDRNFKFTKNENLGHVIYCIGMTSDFRTKLFQTIDAHICKLKEVLLNGTFDSFLYLSSTRVYNGNKYGQEMTSLTVNPLDDSDLYNISKIMGESICLSIPDKNIKIARLSNVIGNNFDSENFIFSLIKEAVNNKKIILNQADSIERDYIPLKNVLELLPQIVLHGKSRIYNIASGKNISNKDIIQEIIKETACSFKFAEEKEELIFPVIDNKKIRDEFSFQSKNIIHEIKGLIKTYKNIKIA